MSDDEKKPAADSSVHSLSSFARPNSLGTGSRSASGTISIDSITPKSSSSSDDDLAIKSSSRSQDEQDASRSRSHTAEAMVAPQQESTATPTPRRPRLYSEEDEDLRKARAMALAIQQHPNMTPEQVHEMHIGDEAQSHIIEQEAQKPSSKDSFLGSIRESQKKTKELFQTMVGTTTSSTTTTPAATPTSSVRSTANSEHNKSPSSVDKTNVISPAAVAKRAVDKAPKPLDVAKAVKDKATHAAPPLAAMKTSPTLSSSKKSKYPVMAAAKAKANSGAAAAKAKASSAASKAKEKMKKKSSRSATSPPPPLSRGATPEALLRTSAPATLQSQLVLATTDDDERTAPRNAAQPTTPSTTENKIRLSANVWKRRGGMGKLSYSKAWERRKVVLQGNRLFYFKNEDDSFDLEQKDAAWFHQAALNLDKAKGAWLATEHDPDAPRGYFDLLREGATVAASSGHSGAPSPFAISIKVKSDTVWKLCFDSHATQMEWLAALTDVVVAASVDTYNANLLFAADPSHEATMFDLEYRPPPGSKEAGQQLWMVGSYRVSSVGYDDGVSEADAMVREPEVSTTMASSDEDLLDVDRWVLQKQDLSALFVIINAGLFLSRCSSMPPQHFWYVLTFCNIGLGYYLVKGYKKRDTSSAPAVVAASGLIKSIVVQEELVLEEEEEEIVGDKPVAGTTTVKLENPSDSPVRDGQVFGAWCAPPGEVLAVRSHGYLATKEKIPSPGELYELVNVDIFESPHRYPDMARRVTLPKVEFEGEDPSKKTWYAPDIFIVSVALPTDPPKMRSSEDGGGFTITMYFAMKQKTRDILRRVTAESYDPLNEPTPEDVQKSTVNAVKLFEEYCRRAPTDPSFQGRFKLVANAQNLKEIGMPSWISKYNGKPVLIKRAGQTGFLFSHPKLSCMEFDVSFHPFPYLAKQAISYMKDNFFKKVLVTFGFVIEGRSDDELPECVIGLMQLCYPDPVYAIQAADFFDGKSPRSF